MQQHGGANADRDAAYARDHRLAAVDERRQETQRRAIKAAIARGGGRKSPIIAGVNAPSTLRSARSAASSGLRLERGVIASYMASVARSFSRAGTSEWCGCRPHR
jgi:hypothetical protein